MKEGEELNHGIILHEEYRERMKKLSSENLGKLVKNMFRIDDGEEVESFGDEYLDLLNETVCGRVEREIKLYDDKSRAGKMGGAPVGNHNASKTQPKNKQKSTKKQAENKQKTSPNTYNQIPITNNQLPIKRQYGVRENVLLTEEEHQKIVSAGYTELIDELSLYIDSKGAKYKSHYSTILAWARRREKESKVVSMSGQDAKSQFNRFKQRDDYDFEAIERKLIRN